MNIVKLTDLNHQQTIDKTIKVLANGGLVVFPSDTVYGLLADAQNPQAIDKLLAFKDRPAGKAISVFMADEKMAGEYVKLNQNAKNVIKNLFPGPFTVICQSKHLTDPRLEAENGTLGFRIPDYPLIIRLVKQFGRPLTATSANLSGQPPPYSVSSLLKSISEKKKGLLDLIIDQGILPPNKPSTVIDTTAGELKTLRLGDLFPKSTNSFISKSEEETRKLGRYLAAKFYNISLSRPLIFLLQGELGAGKTIFAKGVGKALNIKEEIISPTYNISYEYSFWPLIRNDNDSTGHNRTIRHIKPAKLIHFDLFRLESPKEFLELEFEQNLSPGNIYLVEWPERIQKQVISALKKRAEIIYVVLKHLSENEREVKWTISS